MAASRFAHLPVPQNPAADYKKQCVEVPGTKRPGQTAHYRGSAYPYVTIDAPDAFTNLLQIFDEGLRRSKGGRFLGQRPVLSKQPLKYADYHVWQSWPEVDVRRRALGSALHKLFQTGALGGGDLATVGIWSKNCPNWQVIDLALQAYGKVGVSLYDTLGKDSAGAFSVNHAELTVIFATPEHIASLLKLAPKAPVLKMIVSMEPLSPDTKSALSAWGETVNVQIKEIAELEEFGRANLIEVIPAVADQIATICYTSGTTGQPKGVVITHGSMAQAVYGYLHQFEMTSDMSMMSFLPLAHIYERVMELVSVAVGGQIGYTTGDPLLLLDDLKVLQPHFMPSVPRVLNRLYQSAMSAGTAPGIKGALFRKAVATKLHNMRQNGQFTHAFYDRLVFKKLHNVLGGRIRMITTGSAPISANVMDFLKIGLLCTVIEGYGMTENCGSFVRTWTDDPTSSGTVGSPLPNAELKLVDVPTMGYSAEDKPFPRGEICMRGAQRFTCYYKDPKKTAETIDEEGWLHTGDVGLLDDCLRLKIIDRVKNIMKLAQGEYVALENIENIYSGHPLVAQLYVHGDSLQSYLIAVVVPDPVQLAALVSRIRGKAFSPTDLPALAEAAKDPQVVAAVLAELSKPAKKRGLKGFEQLRRIHLTLEALTTENGCLTPTLKIRRKETYEYFKAPLDGLYALGEPSKL
ncbi:acetyl-CoA synthetase-like protein [Trametes versicolor FP-101664 SS1]|uniref:acetyl-CoA synthetase-like protein n=1 Tax=Trametes versicolor (strain FP-101664) TaxID=717944 RepID=UPI0004621B8A|nr:acetyl-CoA synthetase-like protein [Trametes versicolor FP-101664 SS1]EIW60496.1 acetyl-CoA synthetase-like protein [Trametes versicolor FP-101664 SS1]